MYRVYAQNAFILSTLKSSLARLNFSPSEKTRLIVCFGILVVVVQTLQCDMHNAGDALSFVCWQRNR